MICDITLTTCLNLLGLSAKPELSLHRLLNGDSYEVVQDFFCLKKNKLNNKHKKFTNYRRKTKY